MNKTRGQLSKEEIQKEERRKQMIIDNAKRRRQQERRLTQLNSEIKQKQQEALRKHRQSKKEIYGRYLKNKSHEKEKEEKSTSFDKTVPNNFKKSEEFRIQPTKQIKQAQQQNEKQNQLFKFAQPVQKDIEQIKDLIGYQSDEPESHKKQNKIQNKEKTQNLLKNQKPQRPETKGSNILKKLNETIRLKKQKQKDDQNRNPNIAADEKNSQAITVVEEKRLVSKNNITRIRKMGRSQSKQKKKQVQKEQNSIKKVTLDSIPELKNDSGVNKRILQLNSQEKKLQEEIKLLHCENKDKIKNVTDKYHIKTNYHHSENLIKHRTGYFREDQYGKEKKQSQQQIQNSIHCLNGLLSQKQLPNFENSQASEASSIIDPFSDPAEFQKQILKLAENIEKENVHLQKLPSVNFDTENEEEENNEKYEEFQDSLETMQRQKIHVNERFRKVLFD